MHPPSGGDATEAITGSGSDAGVSPAHSSAAGGGGAGGGGPGGAGGGGPGGAGGGGGPLVNAACTATSPFTVTVHGPAPAQAPPQPEKVEPLPGIAVSVSAVPS